METATHLNAAAHRLAAWRAAAACGAPLSEAQLRELVRSSCEGRWSAAQVASATMSLNPTRMRTRPPMQPLLVKQCSPQELQALGGGPSQVPIEQPALEGSAAPMRERLAAAQVIGRASQQRHAERLALMPAPGNCCGFGSKH